MNLKTYLEKRRSFVAPTRRKSCERCRQPELHCYCEMIKPFDPGVDFVILIHPIEARRRIATGRLSHQHLVNSHLIYGKEFGDNPQVDVLINDPSRFPVILYPGKNSVDLTRMPPVSIRALFPDNRRLTVFVIDGTWNTARRMARSPNLQGLPRICFTPEHPSQFRVRKQPAPQYHSTLEAIHKSIELLAPVTGFDLSTGAYRSLLTVFDTIVERQIACTYEHQLRRGETPRLYPAKPIG